MQHDLDLYDDFVCWSLKGNVSHCTDVTFALKNRLVKEPVLRSFGYIVFNRGSTIIMEPLESFDLNLGFSIFYTPPGATVCFYGVKEGNFRVHDFSSENYMGRWFSVTMRNVGENRLQINPYMALGWFRVYCE